jgi:hypothetical protein
VQPDVPDDSITNGFANPVDIFNYLSPAAYIDSIIKSVTGFDPFGYATETLTGEWAKLHAFGTVLGNLGACLQEIGFNIQAATVKADADWDGNANDAAFMYFSSLASTLSRQKAAFDECMKGYHDAARGAWQLSSQLGNVLQALVDKAILFAVAAAAGTATASTGVGALVGYGLAAYQALEVLELANRASTLISTAGAVIVGLFGTGMILGGGGGDLTEVPLPASEFTLPGAGA